MNEKDPLLFWRGIAIIILTAFVVTYPVIWYKSVVKRDIAERYIKTYRGQEPDKDPWGSDYRVRKISEEGLLRVTITSAGPDGDFDTRDDLRGGYVKSVSVEVR
jgi:hypothetical protein